MVQRTHVLAMIALACLAGCARTPPTPRHQCVEIPNGLVECHEIEPTSR